MDLWSNHYIHFYRKHETHAQTRTHFQTENIVALTVDEQRTGPGINQITKQKTKASEGEGKEKNRNDTTFENRPFDWGAQMHLSCTILQSSSGKKKKAIKKKEERE